MTFLRVSAAVHSASSTLTQHADATRALVLVEQRHDLVLVHAGAGGVGLLLTQLATARGARVLATVSTDAKEEPARQGAGGAKDTTDRA